MYVTRNFARLVDISKVLTLIVMTNNSTLIARILTVENL